MFWKKRQVETLSRLPCLPEERSDSENLEYTAVNYRTLSVLTERSDIATLLACPSCPFEGPQFSEDNMDIEPSTLLALRNRCTLAELIQFHPDDVITVLKDFSVAKLGTFKAKDSDVLNAFGSCKMLTHSIDLPDDPYWEEYWRNRIQERSKRSLNSHLVGWEEMVSVSCFAVQIKDIAKTEDEDLIALLLKKTSSGAAPSNVWEFPAVRAVIDCHWQHWARRVMFISFLLYLAWTLSYAAYVYVYIEVKIFDPLGPTNCTCVDSTNGTSVDSANGTSVEALNNTIFLSELLANTRRGSLGSAQTPLVSNLTGGLRDTQYGAFSEDDSFALLTYLFCLLSFIFMLPFAIEEYWTLIAQGNDWLNWRNVLDIGTNGIQAAIFLCHVFDFHLQSDIFACVIALQTVLISIRLLRFVSLLGEGLTFLDTALSVIYAVRYWIAYIIFTGIVSSLCLGALYKTDHSFHTKHKEFRSALSSLVTTFQIIFGSFDVEYIFDTKNNCMWVKFLFFFGFQVLMAITVLNLIIAAMSESYHTVSKNRLSQLYRGRALVIDEINDLRFPRWLVPELMSYIHFVAVEKEAPENKPTANTEVTIESQAQCIQELQDDVKKLTVKLDDMFELLRALAPTVPNRIDCPDN